MGSPLSALSTNFYLIPKRYDTTFEGLFLTTLSALETLAVLKLRSSTEKGQCPRSQVEGVMDVSALALPQESTNADHCLQRGKGDPGSFVLIAFF